MRYAIDLGGTHVRVAAAQSGCEWRHQHRSRRVPGMSAADFIALLTELTLEWGTGPLQTIGVSAAAVVDEDGYLLASENLGWKDVPLRRLLSEAFSCPVLVETDVFCGAAYEARLGAAVGKTSALYVGIGTGVGHALIFNGCVWRGAKRGANAFGHTVVDPSGARCYCGHQGCLCMSASGLAQADQPARDLPLQHLAQAIGNAVTLVEPECVILAGGALNQPWFDLSKLAELIPNFSYPAAVQPQLIRSDAADPNLCGALLLSMEQS
jgi:predicted NBD/HSP70 family sugar kinase